MATYDGFISYSHDADDLLAPRLQAGLQRFAKPWWKRRALRIFRDEASLAANPHLWASIAEALDESDWFVLLLSPEAAESVWVNREVEYWLEHKDPDRIIPVLTEGDFAYADGHIVSDAAPPALTEAFSDEPRWVDLRFARTDEQLDLRNASFRAAVADIASAIRGVPKDELESEEVRQHRRTVRTAWAGGIALLLLTLLAGATAIYANGQRTTTQASEQEATEFARRVLRFSGQLQSSAAPAGTNFVHADIRNIPLTVAESPPATSRLTFLDCGSFYDLGSEGCFASALFRHPVEPIVMGVWLAYEPFHIRHGFVNTEETPLGVAFPPDFDVEVYVTRRQGPELEGDVFVIGRTYRYTADYLVRVTSDRCGPDWRSQTEPLPCDEFVHEFAEGLPPGTYDIWVEWHAPCSAWTTADVCDANDTAVPLFAAEANEQAFYHNDFTPVDEVVLDDAGLVDVDDLQWPFELWEQAQTDQ
jgi:hypothetical protein